KGRCGGRNARHRQERAALTARPRPRSSAPAYASITSTRAPLHARTPRATRPSAPEATLDNTKLYRYLSLASYASAQERHSAGHARAPRAQDARVAGAHARLRDHDPHPTGVRRPAARRRRIALSRAASHGAARLAQGRVGHDGHEPRGQVLLAHREGAEAA